MSITKVKQVQKHAAGIFMAYKSSLFNQVDLINCSNQVNCINVSGMHTANKPIAAKKMQVSCSNVSGINIVLCSRTVAHWDYCSEMVLNKWFSVLSRTWMGVRDDDDEDDDDEDDDEDDDDGEYDDEYNDGVCGTVPFLTNGRKTDYERFFCKNA